MEVWDNLKKTVSTRKNAPKFATTMILFAMMIFTTAKEAFLRTYSAIFWRLNAFLPLPGVSPP